MMQRARIDLDESSSIPRETDRTEGGRVVVGFERVVAQGGERGASESDFPAGCRTARQVCGYSEGAIDDPDRTSEFNSPACLATISRAHARYQSGDPECEADFRAAFLLDAGLAVREIVRRLRDDIRDDLGHVVVSCRERLTLNPQDVFARIRFGVALLMLRQQDYAFRELQQVFRQSPGWRPFLRLLVNEARPRSATVIARM
jgi:hypothetical protein